MTEPPVGKDTVCPECSGEAIAIVPRDSELVTHEEEADGKVRASCKSCGNEFMAYYLTD